MFCFLSICFLFSSLSRRLFTFHKYTKGIAVNEGILKHSVSIARQETKYSNISFFQKEMTRYLHLFTYFALGWGFFLGGGGGRG